MWTHQPLCHITIINNIIYIIKTLINLSLQYNISVKMPLKLAFFSWLSPPYLLTYTTFINKILTYMTTNHRLKRWNLVRFHWSLPTPHQRPQTMKPVWNNIYIFLLQVTSISRSSNNWLVWQWRSPRYLWFFDGYWFEVKLDKLI